MQKRRILANAAASVTQVVLTGVMLFVLYGFLLRELGAEKLGIWSVVMAASAAGSFATLGFGGSVLKFVAKYLALSDHVRVRSVIETSTLVIVVGTGLVILLLYPLVTSLFEIVIPGGGLSAALEILPFAMIGLWLNSIAGVFHAGLDGCQRMGLRSTLLTAGAALFLGLGIGLTPTYGLVGLAWAYIVQSIFLLAAGWFLLRKALNFLPWIPHRFSYRDFKEMWKYSMNFQAIQISKVLYVPATKMFMAKFGGLAMTGYFEMAHRMVQQIQVLIWQANRTLVPVIAGMQETDPKGVKRVYSMSHRILMLVMLPSYAFVGALLPLISILWIGHYEPIFVSYALISILGSAVYLFAQPAYLTYQGVGHLRWNTVGHVSIALSNGLLGYLLGSMFGGPGVVVAWAIATFVGSSIIVIAFHYENRIPLAGLFTIENLLHLVASATALGIGLGLFILLEKSMSIYGIALASIAGVLLILALAVWLHPLRPKLVGWITEAVRGAA